MSNVRTKNDLINIDQFLEQMQNTIYESDENVATRRLGSTTAITTAAAANGNRRRHLLVFGGRATEAKNDLINIDQFLEQMQNTIYESDENVAAAGVAQPGAQEAGEHHRHNHHRRRQRQQAQAFAGIRGQGH
jgi:flagellar biosynthesis chaperone FliJ